MEKNRRQSYTCFRRGGTPEQAIQRLRQAMKHPNLQAQYDYAGVCLRTVMQCVPPDLLGSIPWYDKGALGIPYHRVPCWYREAIGIFEAARSMAHEAMMAEPKPKRR